MLLTACRMFFSEYLPIECDPSCGPHFTAGLAACHRTDVRGVCGIIAIEMLADGRRRQFVRKYAKPEIPSTPDGEVCRRHQTTKPAPVAHDHRPGACQSLDAAQRASEHEIIS